jgi:choline kinase
MNTNDGGIGPKTVVLLGAGRGSRLMPLTADQPKSFTEIGGRRILDWTLDAFRRNGLQRFVFVAGYLKEVVRTAYPDFLYVENPDWANTNMLHSLMCARDDLADGFYSTYTDTLFRDNAVALLKESGHDITLVMDTDWRSRYRFRSEHPESDGEKMIARGDRVTRLSRTIDPAEASGEFTGVLKMTAAGARALMSAYDDTRASLGLDGEFVDGRSFRMGYLIHLLDRMVQAGVRVHCVPVPGDYHEIDTLQDYELARAAWKRPADG